MEQHINFITLGVADLARSRRFYQDVFGWQPTADSNDNIAFYQTGSALLFALFQKDELAKDIGTAAAGNGFPSFTLAHNVGSAEAVDNLFQTLAAKGAIVIKPPQAVFWGGYSGYLTDPDGFLWEIAYNPFLTTLR